MREKNLHKLGDRGDNGTSWQQWESILEVQDFIFGAENFKENGSKIVGKMMQDLMTKKKKEKDGRRRCYGRRRQQGRNKEK